jgi:hypothetical protein
VLEDQAQCIQPVDLQDSFKALSKGIAVCMEHCQPQEEARWKRRQPNQAPGGPWPLRRAAVHHSDSQGLSRVHASEIRTTGGPREQCTRIKLSAFKLAKLHERFEAPRERLLYPSQCFLNIGGSNAVLS